MRGTYIDTDVAFPCSQDKYRPVLMTKQGDTKRCPNAFVTTWVTVKTNPVKQCSRREKKKDIRGQTQLLNRNWHSLSTSFNPLSKNAVFVSIPWRGHGGEVWRPGTPGYGRYGARGRVFIFCRSAGMSHHNKNIAAVLNTLNNSKTSKQRNKIAIVENEWRPWRVHRIWVTSCNGA